MLSGTRLSVTNYIFKVVYMLGMCLVDMYTTGYV